MSPAVITNRTSQMNCSDFILYLENNQSLKAIASKPYKWSDDHSFDAQKMAIDNGIGVTSAESRNGNYLAGGGTCMNFLFMTIFLTQLPKEGLDFGENVCKKAVRDAIAERREKDRRMRRIAIGPAALAFLNFCH